MQANIEIGIGQAFLERLTLLEPGHLYYTVARAENC